MTNTPPKPLHENWRDRIQEDFQELFYEGAKNSVCCKKHKALATPIEVKNFTTYEVEKSLSAYRSALLEKVRGLERESPDKYHSLRDFFNGERGRDGYNEALQNVETIITSTEI